jgi:DNA-binding NtrC family response regulator
MRAGLPAEAAAARAGEAAAEAQRGGRGTSLAPTRRVGKREAMGPLERDRLEQLFEALYEKAVALEGRPSLTLGEWLRHAERWRIRLALEHCGGDRTAAARRLGVPRRSLYYRMQQVGLR